MSNSFTATIPKKLPTSKPKASAEINPRWLAVNCVSSATGLLATLETEFQYLNRVMVPATGNAVSLPLEAVMSGSGMAGSSMAVLVP